jgi:Fe-S cluster biosynthesis and repair protein YggX
MKEINENNLHPQKKEKKELLNPGLENYFIQEKAFVFFCKS